MMLIQFVPLNITHAQTQSTLTVSSQALNGTVFSGMYSVLYSGSGGFLSSGFTPASFSLNNGQNYYVEVDDYGQCFFDHWADTGSTVNPRSISINNNTQIVAVYNCGGVSTSSSVTVNSVNQNNNAITGYYTVLYGSSGNVIATGFTPKTFPTTSGTSYSVSASSYGTCVFSNWSDGVTANPRTFTATSGSLTFTAVYNCGGTTSTTSTSTTSTTTTTSMTSSVTINSVNQNNNAITGYYTVLYGSSGNVIATGFTPKTFPTTSGTSYSVSASSYGTCVFSNWSDGIVDDPRAFTATSGSLTFTAVYNCGGTTSTSSTTTSTTTTSGSTSVLTINSQLSSGGTKTGFYTILYQNGAVVATGFTPAKFTVNNGQSYSVEVQGDTPYYFQYWQDTGSVNALRSVTISSSTSLTAILCNGPPGSCPEPTPVNGITVYVHRIPASYWAPCFALACYNSLLGSNGTGPGATMYVSLWNSAGTLIVSAFVNEQGYTFTGLTPGTTYYVYHADCDLCHGSTHNVTFAYWGNGSSVRPIAVTVGTSLDAWYNCTDGCQ